MKNTSNTKVSYESYMIANGKEGQVFYSTQLDKDLCSLSSKLKRKITTENFISVKVFNKSNTRRKATPECLYLTRVTLLNYSIENETEKK